MMKSIASILCFGFVLCMGTIPSSAAIGDNELWGLYGPGGSGDLAVLSPGTLEWIEKPMMQGNTSGEDESGVADIQAEAKSERGENPFLPATASRKPLYKPGSLIVRFKSDVAGSPDRFARVSDTMHSQLGATVAIDYSELGLPGMQVLQLPKGVSVPEAIAAYSQNPNVLYAEPNYYRYCDGDPDELKHLDLPAPAPMSGGGGGSGRIPNDPGFGNLWGLHNTGQAIIGINGTVGSDIDAPEAWSITTGSQDVIVAVIDTGVMYTHPDLAANIWRNPGEIPDNGIDDDGNGYIDDVCGWDFYSDDNDPGDLDGHGTHCAGTIAAVGNNALGVAGVMWNATIMPLQFLSPDGYGEDADAILAIQYATMMGADIISCSWGGDDDSQALKDAIDATPALVVCAAGNDALDSDAVPHYPSSYDCANILAVAASNNTEQLAWFSNIGATSVDVAAPGASILSTCVIPEWVEVYHDPMDSLEAWDADAPWGLNTVHYTSAPSSADDSPAGKYSPNAEVWLTTKNPIDLQGLQVAELIFDARYDLEDDCDMLYVASSPNGTLYYLHGYLTGSSDGKWYPYGVPLSTYGEDAIYIGFILVTDGSVQRDGVLIDEVYVMGVESVSAGYTYMSGTSMATPHVAGVAGLVRSANASLSATEIKDVIINTADAKPAYAGKMVSGGRVNAYRAVSAVVQAIDPILQSNFTANTTTGTAPLTVQFTDASTGSPNEWFWDFGDNTTSTDQNPIHTYTVPGNYTVSFTVANDHGEDTVTRERYIQVQQPLPRAEFILNVNYNRYGLNDNIASGTSPCRLAYLVSVYNYPDNQENISGDLSFTLDAPEVINAEPEAYVEINGTRLTWTFPEEITIDPGTTLSTQAATSTLVTRTSDITLERSCNRTVFTEAGMQQVTLNMTFDVIDLDNFWGRIECLETGDVRATFVPDTISTDLPLLTSSEESTRIQFTANRSHLEAGRQYTLSCVVAVEPLRPVAYAPACVVWEVRNSTSVTAPAGTQVALPAELLTQSVNDAGFSSNTACEWTCTRNNHVVTSLHQRATPVSTLTANFTANVTAGPAPLAVQFTDNSTGEIATRLWNFDDGATSTEQNPIHTYTTPGTYTARLTITGPGGNAIAERTITVTPSTTGASFTADVTAGTIPLTVRFTDTSAGNPTAWLWSFGDGNTSTEQHPAHTYTVPGNHTVTLTVDGGLSTATKPGYIRATPVLFGDANEDGKVNQADTLLVLQQVVGLQEQPDAGTDRFKKTDVHANNVIEVGDALFIAQRNVGLRDVWFEIL